MGLRTDPREQRVGQYRDSSQDLGGYGLEGHGPCFEIPELQQLHSTANNQGKFSLSSPHSLFCHLSADCAEPSGARLTLLNKALVFLIKPSNSLSR